MSLENQIANAIRSHERWKIKLLQSIESGNLNADAVDIGKDNFCAFGRWLYGSTIPKDARYDPNYIIVQFLHTQFHECAGRVVELLSEGSKTEASALMANNGEYTRISDQLMATMVNWRDSVQKRQSRK